MITFYWDDNKRCNHWNPGVVLGQTLFGEVQDGRPRGYLWDIFLQNCVHRVSTEYDHPGFWYVNLYGYLNEFSGHSIFVTPNGVEEERWDKEASETLIRAIPDHVQKGMRDHNLVLLIDNSAEGKDLTHTEVYYIQAAMKKAGLPRGSIVVVSGALNMNKTYFQMCKDLNYQDYWEIGDPMIDILHLPCFEHLQFITHEEILVNPLHKAMEDPDSKDFMSLNQTIKTHRMEHLYWIIIEDFMDRGLISGSWVREGKLQWQDYLKKGNHATTYIPGSKNMIMIQRTADILPLQADHDCTQRHCDYLPNNHGQFNTDLYERSLLSFVTESEFAKNQNSIFLTEKTYKTMIGGHPFILLSTHGSIAYLESQGYNMQFCDIDLKYDSLTDHKQRFTAAHDELRTWVLRPREEKIELLRRDMHILNHNREKAIQETLQVDESCVSHDRSHVRDTILWKVFNNIEKFLSSKQSILEKKVTTAKFIETCDLDETQQAMLSDLIESEVATRVETEHGESAVAWREKYNAQTLTEAVNEDNDDEK